MKKIIERIAPIAFILAVTCLVFFKIFTKGFYPIPGDLLVSFYFPWYSGGWQGYDKWTTHKELINADAIRQIYLWKEFAFAQFKEGQVPLWNPYTFSGQPLLANLQSSVFYPPNAIYFILDAKNSWILLVISQIFFAALFTYLAARSFKLSKLSSLFSALTFSFSSYLVSWLENVNVGHTYIWLPLTFYFINKYFEKFKLRYIFLLAACFSLSIFAGHPQTVIYIILASLLFFIFKIFSEKIKPIYFISYLFAILLSVGVTAIQLLPTIDFYKESPISLPFAKDIFDRSIFPFKNLVSFLASDFFGHPANNNFWGYSYGDFTPYFGVIPLIFTVWAVIKIKGDKNVKFFAIIFVLFILAATKGPITYLVKNLTIPLLDATSPSRFISISLFAGSILSGYGIASLVQNLHEKSYLKQFLKFSIFVLGLYGLLWLFAIFAINFLSPKDTWQINLAVTRRNLILPTLMAFYVFASMSALLFVTSKKIFKIEKLKLILVTGFFVVTIIGGLYYTNKYLPMSPKKFIYPDHPLFYWLKNNSGIDRHYGVDTAHIDYNYQTHYKVYGAEGYDSLRLERYAQLLASIKSGSVPESYLRSDATFPNESSANRSRIFDLLGIKYLIDKDDIPRTGADWHYERYPFEKLTGHWQYDKFQVYRRETVLPRIFLTSNYFVSEDSKETISKIYDQKFDLRTVILEKSPSLDIVSETNSIELPVLEKYSPNEIKIKTGSDQNKLLFISDPHSNGWHAYINGTETPILRAHYAFRAIEVPKGKNQILLRYQPKSFTWGLYITSTTLFLILISASLLIKRKTF